MVPQDIHKIIGLPATFMEKHLYFLGHQNSMIKTAEAIVKQALPLNISKQDADKFKIAFVIFVMGKFLAPTKDFYTGNFNFWHALVDADEIKNYNWSAYVFSSLMDSARVVFFAKVLKKEVTSIMGCPLLLQVIQK
jgi:hypothetical protein